MKDEIKRILEMSKAGTISDEQAAELIEELSKTPPKEDTHLEFDFSTASAGSFSTFLKQVVATALDSALGNAKTTHPGAAKASSENTVVMSRFESPRGADYTFFGNQINMSSVTGLELNSAKMTNNRIDASKLSDVKVKEAEFKNSQIQASSCDDIELDDGTVVDTKIAGSKCTDWHILNGSHFDSVRINGCSVKDITIEDHSFWRELELNGVAMNDLHLTHSKWHDLKMEGVQIADVSFEDSNIEATQFTGVRVKDVQFTNCEFTEVKFMSEGSWSLKGKGFADTHFENCTLNEIQFIDCAFHDLAIRNVTLSDLKIKNVTLSDRTIDGNDAFLKAIGQI